METQLTLNRGGFPPFSARGCTQTLTPIANGELRRTVNGELLFTGSAAHQKYRARLRCLDQASPALEGISRGEAVEVGCITRLVQELVGDSFTTDVVLARPCVPGSVWATTYDAHQVGIHHIDGNRLSLERAPSLGEKFYLSYQPILSMRVLSFHIETNEWGTQVGWRLDLEEI